MQLITDAGKIVIRENVEVELNLKNQEPFKKPWSELSPLEIDRFMRFKRLVDLEVSRI